MRYTRYLIIGQGIAGSCLAYSLIRRGFNKPEDFIVIDAGLESSSSLVSMGILNPIVFKRMTQSWGSELLSYAWEFYRNFEGFLFGTKTSPQFLWNNELIHIFQNRSEFDQWNNTSLQFKELFFPIANGSNFVGIRNSGWVTAKKLLYTFREYLISTNQLLTQFVTTNQFNFTTRIWKNEENIIAFDYVILCTGVQSRYSNKYNLPDYKLAYYPVKGDIITVCIPNIQKQLYDTYGIKYNKLCGNKILIQPIHPLQGVYRIGSSYVREFKNIHPSNEGVNWILYELQKMGIGNIEELRKSIISQESGIRPSSRDRLAYIGSLYNENEKKQQWKQRVIVFNGLGTRGFMLAPGLSNEICNFLLENKSLPMALSPLR